MIVPGEGRNPAAGSSALMRHSIEWPRRSIDRLVERERFAGGDPELLGDEVERRDHLGDAVLDLQARVHLEEPELAVLVEALHGASVEVAARTGDLHRRVSHRGAHRVVEVGRRALLDQLLVAPLGRAVTLAEPDDVAVGVGEHLDLDVARPGEVALHVALGAPEVRLRLAGRGLERRGRLVGARRDLQPLAPAAVGRLDRDWPAVLVPEGHDLGDVGDGIDGAGNDVDTRRGRGLPRRDLVAHDLDRLGWRADPHRAAGGDRPGEVGVLGEEAVAGVDRLGAAALDRAEDDVGVEVALGRGVPTQRVGLVGVPHVQRVTIEVGVDGDRADPELAAGAHHPNRDLAAVRDENFPEQRCSRLGRRTDAVSYGRARHRQHFGGPLAGTAVRRDRLHQPLPARRGARWRRERHGGGGRPPDRGPRALRPAMGGTPGVLAPRLGAAPAASPWTRRTGR